jgi:hypothetical protein
MILTLDLSALLHTQYIRLKAQVFKLDQNLAERYGQSYAGIKQKMNSTQDWYRNARSEAQSSGTIPLEQKQKETDDRFAQAGLAIARKEQAIKQQLKKRWRTITKS